MERNIPHEQGVSQPLYRVLSDYSRETLFTTGKAGPLLISYCEKSDLKRRLRSVSHVEDCGGNSE